MGSGRGERRERRPSSQLLELIDKKNSTKDGYGYVVGNDCFSGVIFWDLEVTIIDWATPVENWGFGLRSTLEGRGVFWIGYFYLGFFVFAWTFLDWRRHIFASHTDFSVHYLLLWFLFYPS